MENSDMLRVGELAKLTFSMNDNTFRATVTSPSNEQVECIVEETDNGDCNVQFVPTKIGDYLIKVYKGSNIPISQFTYTIVDQDKDPNNEAGIYNSGTVGKNSQNRVFRVGETVRITIIMEDSKITATVMSPNNTLVACETEDVDDASSKIKFMPEQCGDYNIKIFRGNKVVSQLTINVVDSNASQDCSKGHVFKVGELVRFTINIEERKYNITATVRSPSNAEVECFVDEIDETNCKVRFVPTEHGDYVIGIFKNNQAISQFTIKVGDSNTDRESVKDCKYHGGRIFTVGDEVSFSVNIEEHTTKNKFTASVTSPSGTNIKCNVKDLPDGSCKVKFTPKEHGDYVVKVFQNSAEVPCQQFTYKVAETRNAGAFEIMVNLNVHQTKTAAIEWQPNIKVLEMETAHIGYHPHMHDAVKCTAEGLGLYEAKVGEKANFKIDTTNAKRGSILVGVEGPLVPAKELIVTHVGKQVYSVDYILEKVGNYVLHVLFNEHHIRGSPFHVKV